MPSMYVNVPKLPQETKDTLVAKLYEAAAPVLKAPHIYTFVNEYETLYENGKPAPQQMVVANLEAGPTKEEKVNALAEGMRAAVREVLGEDVPLDTPDVVLWIKDYLAEQTAALLQGST